MAKWQKQKRKWKKEQKQAKRDHKDLQKIADYLTELCQAMWLPPIVIRTESAEIAKDGESFTAEIISEDDYLEILVNVDLKKFREKSLSRQFHTLVHEMAHYVEERYTKAVQAYIDACLALIPAKHHAELEPYKKAMSSEEEKLTDHVAFLALDGMPRWKGI